MIKTFLIVVDEGAKKGIMITDREHVNFNTGSRLLNSIKSFSNCLSSSNLK